MHAYSQSIYGAIEAENLTINARTSSLYPSISVKSLTSLISLPYSIVHARCCCNSGMVVEVLIFASADSKSVSVVNANGMRCFDSHSLYGLCFKIGCDGLQGSQRYVFSTGAKRDALRSFLSFCNRTSPNAASSSRPEHFIFPNFWPLAFQPDSGISHFSLKSFIVMATAKPPSSVIPTMKSPHLLPSQQIAALSSLRMSWSTSPWNQWKSSL